MLQIPSTAGDLAKELGVAAALVLLVLDRVFNFLPKMTRQQPTVLSNERLAVLEAEMRSLRQDIEDVKGLADDVNKLVGLLEQIKPSMSSLETRLQRLESFQMGGRRQ